jgi:hypothetical protein
MMGDVRQLPVQGDDSDADHEGSAIRILLRWTDSGGLWRVVSRSAVRVDIALCSCDGGEEMDRLSSTDPAVLRFVGGRSDSEEIV